MGEQIIYLPDIEGIRARVIDSSIRQLCRPAGKASGSIEAVRHQTLCGHKLVPAKSERLSGEVLIISKTTTTKNLPSLVLISPDGPPTDMAALNKCRWLALAPSAPDVAFCAAQCASVIDSWRECFRFTSELRDGDRLIEKGLRPPQIGALHAVLAHWTVSHDPATVVMPTGTGKTETMMAILVAERLERVLVIVPSDALREQISRKFLSLGVLKSCGVLSDDALLPVVGTLMRKPKSVVEVDDFFQRCNVIVTTPQIVGNCEGDIGLRIASLCSHLFVDEAHHVRAPTWERVRSLFGGKPVIQFTATPYRGDGKLVDGKIIYSYPLRKAQEEGYFRSIRFRSVEEYDDEKSDECIAQKAISQLEEDLAAGHDHLLMARCASIRRAELLYVLYGRIAPHHHPVLAHSELNNLQKREAVAQLRSRESRIVVCVDMFGEGFDLPELKVAALHDVPKSMAVTLQFTGRFTRSQSNVGDATVVANIADVEVGEAVQSLYGEDPDWNYLFRILSEQATSEEILRSELLNGFTQVPEQVPLQSIFPKMSTVVYWTRCASWKPEEAASILKNLYDQPALHPKQRVAVLVTKEQTPVVWGDVRQLCNTQYDLYLLHWDEQTKLLYINSSNTLSLHEDLAAAVCGDDVVPIRGEKLFRVLHGINRLILTNLGLGHSLSRAVRHTQYMGADIREGLSEAHAQNKFKTNLFGRGFADGNKTSVGCSVKGRVWSHRVAHDMSEWIGWSHAIGTKLSDEKIDEKEVLKGAMISETVTERPPMIPISIEWSEDLLGRNEEAVRLELTGIEVPLYETGLGLVQYENTGPIRFQVSSEHWPGKSAKFEVRFDTDRVTYVPIGADPFILLGKRKKALSQYLQQEPPIIRFHDGAFLIYNDLFRIAGGARVPFDPARIEAWDWAGVDLTKEAQRQQKRPDSIQRRVIENLLTVDGNQRFDVVFDDDESGEAADVIAIRSDADRLIVRLYHCKFSKETAAGSRVKNLYEVCGQAQRSVYWKGQPAELIEHMLHREAKRLSRGGVSRFERGDQKRSSS